MAAVLVVVADADEDARDGHWSASLAELDTTNETNETNATNERNETPSVVVVPSVGGLSVWDLLPAIADAAIVHVSGPYTPAGEVAVVASKLLGKPLIVSDLTIETSALGRSFDMLRLADVVVCASDAEAAAYDAWSSVEVADLHEVGGPARLLAVYAELASSRREDGR